MRGMDYHAVAHILDFKRIARMGICICEKHRRALMPANQGRVVFYKEELLFRWSNAEMGISGIVRDKELLLREVFVNR